MEIEDMEGVDDPENPVISQTTETEFNNENLLCTDVPGAENNQLIVFLSSEHSNADIDQIRQAIFNVTTAPICAKTGEIGDISENNQMETVSNSASDCLTTSEEILKNGVNGGDETDHECLNKFTCGKCKDCFTDFVHFLEHSIQHFPSFGPFKCELCSMTLNRLVVLKQHYKHKHGLSSFMRIIRTRNLATNKTSKPKRIYRKEPKSKTISNNDSDLQTQRKIENELNTNSDSAIHDSPNKMEDTATEVSVKSSVAVIDPSNLDFYFILCTELNGENHETTATTGMKCFYCDFKTDANKVNMVKHMTCMHDDKVGVNVDTESDAVSLESNEHLMLMSNFIELTTASKTGYYSKSRNNRKRQKQDRPGVFPCPKCGKIFGNLRSLRRHVTTHSTVKSYLCDDCGRGFTTSTYLSLHRKTHRPKLFQCNQCDFASNSNPAIHAHRQVHSQGSVLCDLCGYAYNDRSTLLKHKQVHDPSRPYACSYQNCTWRFKTEMMCRAHIKAHTTEGKFKCSFCGYIFRHKHHLQRHEAKIHGVQHIKRSEKQTIPPEVVSLTVNPDVSPEQLQLQLQPQQLVVTTDTQGTPITYETTDISGLAYQTLLQTQDVQGQEACTIYIDGTDGIVYQHE